MSQTPAVGNLSSASQPSKQTGTCPVCQVSNLRLTAGGKLYNHGPRGGKCGGVGTRPSSSTQPVPFPVTQPSPSGASALPIGGGTAQAQSSPSLAFLITSLPPLIKWIPRAARQHCATLLTKIIQAVISNPNNLQGWEYLLTFGRVILNRPARSSSMRNLSNILGQRCRTFGGAMTK